MLDINLQTIYKKLFKYYYKWIYLALLKVVDKFIYIFVYFTKTDLLVNLV